MSPLIHRDRRPRAGGLAAALAMLLAVTPALASGPLSGRVLGPAGVTPITQARVTLYHLASGTTYTTEATAGEGAFDLPGLPAGEFDLAVVTERGLWLADAPLTLAEGEARSLSLSLRELAYWEGADQPSPRTSPLGENIVGKAVVLEEGPAGGLEAPAGNKKKIAWGVGAGLGVLALALLAADDSDGQSAASPFTP